MILLSELSRRRIRSIQKLIRVGRNEVVVVLRVDKEKGEFGSTRFERREKRAWIMRARRQIVRKAQDGKPCFDFDGSRGQESLTRPGGGGRKGGEASQEQESRARTSPFELFFISCIWPVSFRARLALAFLLGMFSLTVHPLYQDTLTFPSVVSRPRTLRSARRSTRRASSFTLSSPTSLARWRSTSRCFTRRLPGRSARSTGTATTPSSSPSGTLPLSSSPL